MTAQRLYDMISKYKTITGENPRYVIMNESELEETKVYTNAAAYFKPDEQPSSRVMCGLEVVFVKGPIQPMLGY